MHVSNCRFCGNPLIYSFADLGMSPLANSYIKREELQQVESYYPLHAHVCQECYLVQLPEFTSPEHIFSDYAYFSSYSELWLNHARTYTEMMIKQFGFDSNSQVIEIASNDGYLLQFFKEKNIPILGIEPAVNVAKVAIDSGIPTITKFFGVATAKELIENNRNADLLIANNVLAHVPDLNDFVEGMKILLNSSGVITIEFPHLMHLLVKNQFDTIYHEHFSYFSFFTVNRVFAAHNLKIFDVDEIPTHGGSLRIYACHSKNKNRSISNRVKDLLSRENDLGLHKIDTYLSFNERIRMVKRNILEFMIEVKNKNRSMVGYGAPAKGNTLLNYCGIRTDFLDYTVDRSPHKQEHYLPGTHIPIFHPDHIKNTKPDFLVILPWNIKDEIIEQMDFIRSWGGRFVVLIPEVRVYE